MRCGRTKCVGFEASNDSLSNMFVLYRGARQSIDLMGGSPWGGGRGGDIGPDDPISFKSLVYSSVYGSRLFFSFINYLCLFVFFVFFSGHVWWSCDR